MSLSFMIFTVIDKSSPEPMHEFSNPTVYLCIWPATLPRPSLTYMCFFPQDVRGWAPNDRGVSWIFGGDVLRAFLEHHNLSLVVRAHQVQAKL